MKITRVEVYPLKVLFADIYGSSDKVPAHVAQPASHFRQFRRRGQYVTLVRIETDGGFVGVGEAFGLPLPTVSAEIVRGLIGPELMGRDPLKAEAIWDEFYSYFRALGHTRGPMMEALSAADIALWDIKAKALGLPLWRLLGGQRQRIEAYASPVPFYDDPKDTRERAQGYRQEGFRGVKLKIGRGLKTDLEHVAAAREGLGEQGTLMVDANCAYDIPAAIELARALAAYGVAWLEEPLASDDIQGLAKLRKASTIPIAAGENEFTPFGVENLLCSEAVDIVQPNITRAGGVTGALRIAELAHTHGVRFAPHGVGSWVGIAAMLHVCAVAPTFLVYEANRLDNPLRDGALSTKFPMEEGEFVLPSHPGLGIEVDWTVARTYLERQVI